MRTINDSPSVLLAEIRDVEVVEEIRSILKVIANWMAIPLFLLFWGADLIYAPEWKWEFLAIRLMTLPICLAVTYFSKKITTAKRLRYLGVTYTICLASGINLMIYLINDPGTPYYAGLFLVLLGSGSFIPYKKREYLLNGVGIYGLYYAIVINQALSSANPTQGFKEIATNSFFILSSIAMCFLIRFFHENLRIKEIGARKLLNEEVLNREEIIRQKTDEGVALANLSRQFSPQVVDSIKTGKIKFEDGVTKTQICAVFIDIVNSTDRIVRLEKENVEKVLTHFLDDTIKIMLKYDLTIDKFLGDGVLAFCNAPLKRNDFAQRVLRATIEIREKIKADQDFYEKLWLKSFEIRAGVASGSVNVGFYGSKKYYQTYTAIGPVVNLASRLCSAAEPNQIVTDWDVAENIKEEFTTRSIGKKTLKGFDQDMIHVFEVLDVSKKAELMGSSECPSCGGLLSLETNDKGQFVFMCRSCCTVVESSADTSVPDKRPSVA